ncbi:MAG TPA: ATP-binding cassette domain-containing protein [Candidatus Sulfopaludibacter sp.]|jgi:ABC-2 type transport system ATP-binding protein|nr:ATP-binding cassette domain-containing protein [Candidatus Sulfopaludibacter sp.]
MGIGIRIEHLRKVYDTPPPSAARGGGFSFTSVRSGPKQEKKKLEVVALEDVSMEIRAGEIFGLLGPNGAGKSTTIGILTTRTQPTSGRAFIGEFDVWQQQVKAKCLIGVVPQRPNLDFALTAREILLFHGAYFGQGGREREQKAQALLEKFKLTDRADQMVRGFSGGMMQRLSIARAMMHDPEVLFLDEPSAGLDPQTRLLLWEIIRDYNRAGKTIVLTTHYMDEADALCERLAIIDHGCIISQGTPQELKSSIPGGYLLRLRLTSVPEALSEALKALPGVTEVRSKNADSVDVYADRGGQLIGAIVAAAQSAGVELCDVHIAEPSLETLFLHHTGRSLRD